MPIIVIRIRRLSTDRNVNNAGVPPNFKTNP
jgi:hypothetical protein